jgi:hypothetical protein
VLQAETEALVSSTAYQVHLYFILAVEAAVLDAIQELQKLEMVALAAVAVVVAIKVHQV